MEVGDQALNINTKNFKRRKIIKNPYNQCVSHRLIDDYYPKISDNLIDT